MPTYCYTTWDGRTIEATFPMNDRPEIILTEDDWPAYRDFNSEWNGRHRHGDLWPRWSDAAGINPDQLQSALAADKEFGVTAEYNSEGQVKFESRQHEKKFLEARGMYHLNSYGGKDAQRITDGERDRRYPFVGEH